MANTKLLNTLSLLLLYANIILGFFIIPFLLSYDISGHQEFTPLSSFVASAFLGGAVVSVLHGLVFYFRWRAKTKFDKIGLIFAGIVAIIAGLFLLLSSFQTTTPALICFALTLLVYPSLNLAFIVISLDEQFKKR